jgi:uncharacterized protein
VTRPLQCPTCARPIEWSDAFPFRPFCSERCRLIDLGGWFSEERRIPGESSGGAEQSGERLDDDKPEVRSEEGGAHERRRN